MAKTRARLNATQKTVVVCALFFLLLLFVGLFVNLIRRGRLSAKTRALQAEIARLAEEKESNNRLLADLNSGEFTDAYAREQGLKKKDEHVYRGVE